MLISEDMLINEGSSIILKKDSSFSFVTLRDGFSPDEIIGVWELKNDNRIQLYTKCVDYIDKSIEYVYGGSDSAVIRVEYLSENIESRMDNYFECLLFYNDTIIPKNSNGEGIVRVSTEYGELDSIFISPNPRTGSLLEVIKIPNNLQESLSAIVLRLPVTDLPCISGSMFEIVNDSTMKPIF
jgi:hypothetical protein